MKLITRISALIPKPAKIWAGRLAAAALAAIVHALQQGKLPHTVGDVGALVSGAVVAATPALAASGLFRPISDGKPSIAQRVWNGLATVVAAPSNKRKAAAEAVLAEAKANAERAGKAAAQAEIANLKKELTLKLQQTEAGCVPIEETVDNTIPDVAGTAPEVIVPQDVQPAVLQ